MSQKDGRVRTRKKSTNIKICENSNEKKHICEQCSWSFKRQADLKKHLIVHSDLKPFKCHICSKSFKRSSDAKDHLIVHSDARPFCCSMCDKSFKRLPSLKLHENTTHYKITEKVSSKDSSLVSSVRPNKARVTSLNVQKDLNVNTSRKPDSSKLRYCHLKKDSKMFEDEKRSYIGEVEDALKLLYSLRGDDKQILFDGTNQKPEDYDKSFESTKLKELDTERFDSSKTHPNACKLRKTIPEKFSESVENMKLYKCGQCGFLYGEFRLLKTHMHHAHASQKHYACGHCNRRFKKSRSLKEHVKSVNETERQKSRENSLRVTLMETYNSKLKISLNPTKHKENSKGDHIFETDPLDNNASFDKNPLKKRSFSVTTTTQTINKEHQNFQCRGHAEKEHFFSDNNIGEVDENSDEYLRISLDEETMFGSKDWQALIDETIGEENIDEYLRLELFPGFPFE